jgi:molybdopterin converting factor small subunit
MVQIRLDRSLLAAPLKDHIKAVPISEQKLIISVLPAGSLLDTLKKNGIQLTQPVAAVINGETSDLEQEIHSGDNIILLPQISGG